MRTIKEEEQVLTHENIQQICHAFLEREVSSSTPVGTRKISKGGIIRYHPDANRLVGSMIPDRVCFCSLVLSRSGRRCVIPPKQPRLASFDPCCIIPPRRFRDYGAVDAMANTISLSGYSTYITAGTKKDKLKKSYQKRL